MAKRTTEERVEILKEKIAACEARIRAHGAKADGYRLKGKVDQAEASEATVARQEAILINHRNELEAVQDTARRAARVREEAARVHGQREAEMRRSDERARLRAQADRPDPLVIYTEALQHAADARQKAEDLEKKAASYERAGDREKAALVRDRAASADRNSHEWGGRAEREASVAQNSHGRDLVREHAIASKARERDERSTAKAERRLNDLKLESDLRTAASQREFVARGERGKRGASLAEYEALLRRPQDRTRPRLKAMADFDDLCAAADAGLFPEQKLERESSAGKGPGGLAMLERAAGLTELDALRNAIGARNVEMLKQRIAGRVTLTQLVRDGFGGETEIAALVLAALDSLVVYFRTRASLTQSLALGRAINSSRPSI